MPRRTPEHIRNAAVADYLAGESCQVVALRYGVSSTAVCKWAVKDHGYVRERWQHIQTIDDSPATYEGGWRRVGGVMRPLEPVRRAG